jgi:hypothetical protein
MNQKPPPTISREARSVSNNSANEQEEHAELVSNLSIFRDLPPLDSNGMPTTTTTTAASPFRRATHITQSRSDEVGSNSNSSSSRSSNFRRAAITAPTATARSFGGFNSERRHVAPTNPDDMIEREQLWKLQPAATVDAATRSSSSSLEASPQEQREPTNSSSGIDFAPYFTFSAPFIQGGATVAAAAQAGTMDCDDDDDFSVSSREADSLLSEEDLENISKDPVSFWEGSIDSILFDATYRSVSPDPADQQSMMEIDNHQETLPSPTSVAAIASIGLSHK